jgi:hypothetical protein
MRFRLLGQVVPLAVFGLLFVGSFVANAAIIGTATLIKEPAAAPFGAPDAALGSPWVSYRLSLQGTEGEIIQAVEATISGQLHQRWDDIDFDDDPTNNPTGNSANQTSGDSHLLAPAGSLFGSGPTETNPGTGSPLSAGNTTSRMYGVGNMLQGAWSLVAPNILSTANVAYIVVPKGSEPSLQIGVKVASPTGAIIGNLDVEDFFGPAGIAPLVADLPQFNTTALGEVVNLQPIDTAPGTAPVGWTIGAPTYVPDFGALPGAPGLGTATYGIDPNTGAFTFNTNGATRGVYTFAGTASNTIGSDPFSITVGVTQVPEPATFALVGLALVGFAGFRRK